MQYSNINLDNAEKIMQKMTDKGSLSKFFNSVSERNGVKFACDRYKSAVILPDGIDEWDLSDAYFETGNEKNPKFEFSRHFNRAKENSVLNFKITKKQAKDLLVYLDGLKGIIKESAVSDESDFEEESFFFTYTLYNLSAAYSSTPMKAKLNVNKMEFVKEWDDEQCMIAFNPNYIKEALSFILCSDNEYIEVYYVGSTDIFIMKSAQLYVGVVPVRLNNRYIENKKNRYSFRNSHDIAECCRKINKTWTPFEMAVIICGSQSTLTEKHTVWRELISDYPDMPVPKNGTHEEGFDSLHQKLAGLINYEEHLIKLFEKSDSGCDVLGSAVYAWHGESVFLTLEETLTDIREHYGSREEIKIKINKLFGDNGKNGSIVAVVDYDGNIYSISGSWSLDYEGGDLGEQLHQLLFGKDEFGPFLYLGTYESEIYKKFEL